MTIRPYHAAVWNEPLIHDQTSPGERGILLPVTEPEILKKIGPTDNLIPAAMRRKHSPPLPELSQAQVLRHWLRLSQMTLGMELDIDLSVGTCTMKYSPKVNERLVTEILDIHPDQPEETMQGLLEIVWRLGHIYLQEISGMDEWTFQPPGGSAGAFNNAAIMRKYHHDNGKLEQRDEIITTIFSHPCDAACPATAGFKIITLYPEPDTGLPSIEALKAATGPHTAGFFITNPEDTGIFNKEIDEWTGIIHDAGGLCAYDQANANALLGVTRAKEAGFDMCFFNLHKTFSSPTEVAAQGPPLLASHPT